MDNFFAKRIIPCLDVKDGRVVKGVNFVGLKDAGDPVEVAKRYNEEGADELTFLDITASHEERDTIVHIVEQVAKEVFIPLTVGGGIRVLDDIYRLLAVGCDKVSINSAAIKRPEFINEGSKRFGSQCIVVAIDAKLHMANGISHMDKSTISYKPQAISNKWEVYINGGRTPTGLDALKWAKKAVSLGAGEILLTSIDTDGMKRGFDIGLTKMISKNVNVPIIASGGAGKIEDFFEIFKKGKADAALAASLFHFGELTINQVKNYLKNRNIPVRLI